MKNNKDVLGILGGMGPMATVYFYELLIKHIDVKGDSDNIDVIISGRSSTPDRTEYITGKHDDNPLDVMAEDLKYLIDYGAKYIAIPCNTAHYFYEDLSKNVEVTIFHMIKDTIKMLSKMTKTIGLMATEGTVNTKIYEKIANDYGIKCINPNPKYQKKTMDLIYGTIKQNEELDLNTFNEIKNHLLEQGCEYIILGCSELSIIKRNEPLESIFIDPLEVLAFRSIISFNKEPILFPSYFKNIL